MHEVIEKTIKRTKKISTNDTNTIFFIQLINTDRHKWINTTRAEMDIGKKRPQPQNICFRDRETSLVTEWPPRPENGIGPDDYRVLVSDPWTQERLKKYFHMINRCHTMIAAVDINQTLVDKK